MNNPSISPVTSQRYPTLIEAIVEILYCYMDTEGYGEFYDAYKVLSRSSPADIGHELIVMMQWMSDGAMLKNNLCEDCGTKLVINPEREKKNCPKCLFDYPISY